MESSIIKFKDFLTFATESSDSFDNNSDEFVDESDTSNDENDSFLLTEERLKYLIDDFELSESDISKIKSIEETEETEKEFYKLYKDINESFTCDIFIEGANPEKSKVRLILESDDWNLVFNGEIFNGKCIIPIKKLDILKENLVGDIRLEVIAEGNVFIPWEDKFLIKSSKKVSTVNEKIEKKVEVKVDKIR